MLSEEGVYDSVKGWKSRLDGDSADFVGLAILRLSVDFLSRCGVLGAELVEPLDRGEDGVEPSVLESGGDSNPREGTGGTGGIFVSSSSSSLPC